MTERGGRIDIIDGRIVVDNGEAELYRRMIRENQDNPMVARYWAEHNQKLRAQVGLPMERRPKAKE